MTLPDPQPVQSQSHRVLFSARALVVLICLALLGMVGRVVQLQLRPAPQLEEHRVHTEAEGKIFARRGALLDRKGRPFAVTHVGYRLYADPQMIKDWGDFAAQVAYAIGENPVAMEQALDEAGDRRYVVLHELLTESQYEAASKLKLPGLGMEQRPVREYPQGLLASQIVGFVGKEDKGLDGLEFKLEPILLGKPGRVSTLRDVHRRALWIEKEGFEPPVDGMDVRLSLDSVVQNIAEEELAQVCKKHRADRGEIVVMDAHTGQLLAIANYPFFDPAKPSGKLADKARRNRCVTDPFEPGSIFKPFVHAAVTSAGVANVGQLVDCTDSGYWVTGFGRNLRDAHAHGTISWGKVLVVSSNIGMGKIGERFGATRMYEAVHGFGFGSFSGTGLPGESAGILVPLKKWTKYSVTSVPMGQEIGVTPVQMVRAFSAFANGGMVVSPSILADETQAPRYQRAVAAKAAESTRELLRKVVTEGTGKNAISDRYQIWGKTGTAQVPDPKHGGYKAQAYTASFICGAPMKNPEIIVLVTVHEPDPKIAHYGGVVAAPAAKNVVERVLTYMGVQPDVLDDQPLHTAQAPSDHD